jgi:hypothetical protein
MKAIASFYKDTATAEIYIATPTRELVLALDAFGVLSVK